MGCAIGMTVAAACEIIYWMTLKPLIKWMSTKTDSMDISPRFKNAYVCGFILIFLSWIAFSIIQFYPVYVTFQTRSY